MADGIVWATPVCGVYLITNTVNGKKYVGSSVDVRGRMYKHRNHLLQGIHKNAHLQAAFAKYGEAAFSVSMIEECAKAALLGREQHHIDAVRPEYNVLPVAGSSIGYRHSPEARAKMTQANMGNQRWLGRCHTDETKKKIGARRAGSKLSAEHAERIRQSLYGNQHTAGRPLSEEHKAKVSAASLRMWQDDARRARRSEDTRTRWADPAWKAEQLKRIAAGRAAKRAARGLE